jgi:hypothetical protein
MAPINPLYVPTLPMLIVDPVAVGTVVVFFVVPAVLPLDAVPVPPEVAAAPPVPPVAPVPEDAPVPVAP